MILVGCPVAAFKMGTDHWGHWIENAIQVTEAARAAGVQVRWHAVLHMDGRGEAPFEPLLEALDILQLRGIDTTYSAFLVELHDVKLDLTNRLSYICIGRNLVIDQALRDERVEWIWNVDDDISYPDDVLSKLLELGYPVCGCRVPQWGITGLPAICDDDPDIDARWHWNGGGALFIHRSVFERVPWRWGWNHSEHKHKPTTIQSEDFATCQEMEAIGWPCLVRHDVVAQHQPPDDEYKWGIRAYDERPYDLVVRR